MEENKLVALRECADEIASAVCGGSGSVDNEQQISILFEQLKQVIAWDSILHNVGYSSSVNIRHDAKESGAVNLTAGTVDNLNNDLLMLSSIVLPFFRIKRTRTEKNSRGVFFR